MKAIWKNKGRTSVLLLILALLLAGCKPQEIEPPHKGDATIPGGLIGAAGGVAIGAIASVNIPAAAVIGGLAGGLVGYDISHKKDTFQKRKARMRAQGVKFIYLGEYITIVIPADKIFYPYSPRIRWSAYSLLNDIADYIHYYEKISLSISVFTDDLGPPTRGHVMTDAQASKIVDFLTRRDVDARLIYGVGYGGTHPIASNQSARGQTLNRRIEITFMRQMD